MCSSTKMNKNKNALVLIPCCKQKKVAPFLGQLRQIPGIQQLRTQLLQQIQQTPALANKPKNLRGILNPKAPLTQSINLYVGNFYKVAKDSLQNIMTGRYPSINVLIVSAFYGLAKLDEGLKEYELQMGDTLYNGMKVYQFWQQKNLWQILQNYISQNNIAYVWSLLPDSMPSFPYHRVFNNLWRVLRNTQVQCFHLQVPGAGTGTGHRRAQWLVQILNANPNHLVGVPFPPNRLGGYVFRTCDVNRKDKGGSKV